VVGAQGAGRRGGLPRCAVMMLMVLMVGVHNHECAPAVENIEPLSDWSLTWSQMKDAECQRRSPAVVSREFQTTRSKRN